MLALSQWVPLSIMGAGTQLVRLKALAWSGGEEAADNLRVIYCQWST